MQLTPAWSLLLLLLVGELRAQSGPDVCNADDFNEPKLNSKRRDEHKRALTDIPEMNLTPPTDITNAELKKFFDLRTRPKNQPAPVVKVPESQGGIPNDYIVILFQNDKEKQFEDKYFDKIKEKYELEENGATVFLVNCDEQTVEEMCTEPEVAMIQQNVKHELSDCEAQRIQYDNGTYIASWGLGRIGRRCGRDQFYYHNDKNKEDDVIVYVLDSGIDKARQDEFGDRLRDGPDFSNSTGGSLQDNVGHGTHVSGIIGSKTFGVAKDVILYSVKLSDDGRLDEFRVQQGLIWVKNHVKKKKKKNRAIANLALNGPASKLINTIVNSLVEEGVTVIGSVGNNVDDACCYSPSSARGAIGVGCTTIEDGFCPKSNFGKCLDILAPGRLIASVALDINADSVLSGTSMSTSFVSGVAAVLMGQSRCGLTPKRVRDKLLKGATKNTIKDVPFRDVTPNRLLHLRCT